MLRALSDLESFYIEKEITIVTVADLEGTVNPLILQKAIAAVVKSHPLLSSEVRSTPEGDCFYQRASCDDKMIVLGAVDKEKQKHMIVSELNQPLSKTSLFRFTLLLEEKVGIIKSQKITLISTIHHSVSDGICCIALQDQIWKTYAEMIADAPLTISSYPLLPAVEQLIPSHFSETELEDYIARYMQTAKHFHPFTLKTAEKGDTEIEMRYLRKKLTIKQTKAIVDQCSQLNISVHGAISAAHAMAMQQLSGIDGPVDLSCHSPVNIRPFLNPAVDDNAMVSAAIGCTHYQSVSPDASFVQLSEAISKTIHDSIENGDIFKSLLTVRETRLKVFLGTSIGISNVGVVKLPRISRKLKLTAMNFIARFPFPALTAYVSTSGDRLVMMYPYAKPYYSSKTISKLAELAETYLFKYLPCEE